MSEHNYPGDGANPYSGQAAESAYPTAEPAYPTAAFPMGQGGVGAPGEFGEPAGAAEVARKRSRRWVAPVIVGVLAFVIGVAAGAGGEEAAPAGDLDAEIEAAVAEVEGERDALAAELEELETERDGLAADLEDVSAERDEIAGEVADARTERDEAVERVQAIEAENEEAQAVAEAEAEAAAEAAEPSASFGNGTWRVGDDIEPGTYRTDGASGCYWERLSGFSGEFGDIIANDFTSGPSTVTIQASDAGFSSQGCGTWESLD